MKTDFLVIGSGAAGLSFALKAAAHGHVTIVTKGAIEECNTNYAQGGICSVTYAPDTFEKHIRDTLVCGAGKCDEKAVELVVRRAPELIARPDRLGHALRQDPRRAFRAQPRRRTLGAPHPPPRGPHGSRDRTGARAVGEGASEHHGSRTPLRHRPADAAPSGRIRHAPHARTGLRSGPTS